MSTPALKYLSEDELWQESPATEAPSESPSESPFLSEEELWKKPAKQTAPNIEIDLPVLEGSASGEPSDVFIDTDQMARALWEGDNVQPKGERPPVPFEVAYDPYGSAVKSAGLGFIASLGNIPTLIANAINRPVNEAIKSVGLSDEDVFKASKLPGIEKLEEAAKYYTPPKAREGWDEQNTLSDKADWIGQGLATQSVNMALNAASMWSKIARVVTLPLMAASSAGQQYGENLREDRENPELDALLNGFVEYWTERASLGVFDKIRETFGKLVTPAAKASFLNAAMRRTVATVGAITATAGEEGIEETTAQYLQNLSQIYVAGDESIAPKTYVKEATILGTAGGGVMAAPFAVAGGQQSTKKPEVGEPNIFRQPQTSPSTSPSATSTPITTNLTNLDDNALVEAIQAETSIEGAVASMNKAVEGDPKQTTIQPEGFTPSATEAEYQKALYDQLQRKANAENVRSDQEVLPEARSLQEEIQTTRRDDVQLPPQTEAGQPIQRPGPVVQGEPVILGKPVSEHPTRQLELIARSTKLPAIKQAVEAELQKRAALTAAETPQAVFPEIQPEAQPPIEAATQTVVGAVVPKTGITPADIDRAKLAGLKNAKPTAKPAKVDKATPFQAQPDIGQTTMQNRDRDRPVSIQQMQAIANDPDPDRLSFSPVPDSGAPMAHAVGQAAIAESDFGKESVVTMADGTKVQVRYAVVEADSVLASHDANGAQNAEYNTPPEGKLRALNNGRTAGLQAAYRRGTADNYRTGIAGMTDQHGVSQEAIAAKKQPIIVRLYGEDQNRRNMARLSNTGQGLGFSATETALNDAQAADISQFRPGENGEMLVASNRDFLKAFMAQIPGNERAAMIDANGSYTKQFADRVQAAVFAKAYRDSDLLALFAETADPDIKNLLQALTIAAPEFAKIENAGDLDIRPHIVGAVKFIKNAKAKGRTVEIALSQADMFGRDVLVDRMADFMGRNIRSPRRMGEGLAEGARFIQNEVTHAANADMFGGRQVSVDNIIERINTYLVEHYGQEARIIQTDLFGEPGGAEEVSVGVPVIGNESRQQKESGRADTQAADVAPSAEEKPVEVKQAEKPLSAEEEERYQELNEYAEAGELNKDGMDGAGVPGSGIAAAWKEYQSLKRRRAASEAITKGVQYTDEVQTAKGKPDLEVSEGREATEIQGYPITRKEADRLSKSVFGVFRVPKSPDSTGEEGWYLNPTFSGQPTGDAALLVKEITNRPIKKFQPRDIRLTTGQDKLPEKRQTYYSVPPGLVNSSPHKPGEGAPKPIDVAKQVSRKDTTRFSRPTETRPPGGFSTSDARAELVNAFGERDVSALESAGILNIVQSVKDAPAAVREAMIGNEEGLFLNGRAWLFVDNFTTLENRRSISVDIITAHNDSFGFEVSPNSGFANTEQRRKTDNARTTSVERDTKANVPSSLPIPSSFGKKSSGLKRRPDGAPMQPVDIGDFLISSPAFPHLKRFFEVPGQRFTVDPSVVPNSKELKVVDGVIKSIPVDMMDVLVSGKGPTNEPFHNQSMFALLPDSLIETVSLPEDISGSALSINVPGFGHRRSRAVNIALHEIGAHYNLKNMLGEKGYKALKNRMTLMRGGKGAIGEAWRSVRRDYTEFFDKRVVSLKDDIKTSGDSDTTDLNSQLRYAEQYAEQYAEGAPAFMQEVIARVGENAEVRKTSWWKELIQAFKLFLLKNGISIRLNDKDIGDLLVASLKLAAQQAQVTSDAVGQEALDITPAMRESVMQKGPLFARPDTTSTLPPETKAQLTERKTRDRMNRFRVIKEWLEKQGKPLTELADVHMHENLSFSKLATQKEDFREQFVTPYIHKIVDEGFTLDQIDNFLKMQHAKEANAQQRKIHNDEAKTAYGITDEEAEAGLDEYRGMPNFERFSELAEELRSLSDHGLDMMVEEGIIAPERKAAYRETYSLYIPVKGEDDSKGNVTGQRLRSGQKRRLGHELREEAVVENIMRQYEQYMLIREINNVRLSMAAFLLEANDPNIGTIGRPVKRQVFRNEKSFEVTFQGGSIAVFNNKARAQEFITNQIVQPEFGRGEKASLQDFAINEINNPMVALMTPPELADNEVNVYVNGYEIRMQFNDELMARAATRLTHEQLGVVLSAARGLNRYLSHIYTGYNIEFAPVNMMRDFGAGVINLTGDYGFGTAMRIVLEYPIAMKELSKHFIKFGSSDKTNAYRKAGGSLGAAWLSSLERIGKELDASFHEAIGAQETYKKVFSEEIEKGSSHTKAHTLALAKSGLAGFKEIPVVGHFLTLAEHITAVSENALRLATFTVLKRKGFSDSKAALAAKDSTINFDKKGEIGATAGAMYLFYNPAAQGIVRSIEVLAKSEHKGQARILVGAMTTAAFLLAEMTRNGGEDDEREWRKISQAVKDRNLIIKIGKTFIKLPVSYEFGFFSSLGYAISDIIHGISPGKAAFNLAIAGLKSTIPIGDPIGDEGDFKLFQTLPTLFKIAGGPEANQTGFGRPIYPEKYKESKPDSQNMWRNTKGSTYAKVSEWMNAMTGGSKFEKGYIDVSPETLKFWVNTLGGGPVRVPVDTIHAAANLLREIPPDSRDVPIWRRFVGEVGVTDARRLFWDSTKDVRESTEARKSAMTARDFSTANRILNSNKDMILLSNQIKNVSEMAKRKRDAIDEIRLDGKLDLKQKNDKIKKIEQEEEKLYDNYIDSLIKQKNRGDLNARKRILR